MENTSMAGAPSMNWKMQPSIDNPPCLEPGALLSGIPWNFSLKNCAFAGHAASRIRTRRMLVFFISFAKIRKVYAVSLFFLNFAYV